FDSELTVLNDCSFKWSLSSLINLFDYHQRVPTQIDWFTLLKSLAFSALARQRGAYNTLPTLKVNIKL
ncbi:hypothetical protein, partial [Vibrio cholerae]|uniref:hypothetical protein n=2 Tax=Vibrio cholerae TaxID=666 RepID=UPI00265829A2